MESNHCELGYEKVAKLLSPQPSRVRITSPIDLHDLIRTGLPRDWVVHFVGNVDGLPLNESLRVLNISDRTFHRIKSEKHKARLGVDQSARLWNFAEVLVKAEGVFGSREAALEWLRKRVIGLEGHHPLGLMQTPQGTQVVKTLLARMKYGVYA